MSRGTLRCFGWIGVALLWLAAVGASAAPPLAPERVSYQGLLLDGDGSPRTGSVDLRIRIYDALSAGTLLYVQQFDAVTLTDGVFTVVLGSSGEASDLPVDPLTTSLGDALVADLGATGESRFLEVTVGSEGALARTQILAVPYALHAESAEVADFAALADEATLAQSAQAVGGLGSDFVTQLYEHSNHDGVGPPNADPTEGLADPDADGFANFIDPDNDDDGMDDSFENAQGSDINLVTPTITGFTPATSDADLTRTITVQGTNFEPAISVAFGSQSPTPGNVTPTSLEVDVGPQPPGFKTVTLTRTNGESASSNAFEFLKIIPTITSFSPSTGSGSEPTLVTMFGTNFQVGMSVVFGSETPTPTNVTPTSAQVLVGPQSGVVDVTVTLVNGNSDTAPYLFREADGDPLPHPVTPGGQMSFGVKGALQTVLGTEVEYGVDTDADRVPDLVLPFTSSSQTTLGQIAVSWDPSGRVAGVRCRPGGSASECSVELAVDLDADFELEDEAGIPIETISGGTLARIESPSLAFDAAGHAVVGYLRRRVVIPDVVVAHDIDGDGQFTGTNEVAVVDTAPGASTHCGAVATSPSGEVAYAYRELASYLVVRRDPEGDGTYISNGRSTTGSIACVGAAYDASGSLWVVYGSSSDGVVRWKPKTGQTEILSGDPATACDIAGASGGEGLAVAHNAGGLQLLVDRDNDGTLEWSLELEDPTTVTTLRLSRDVGPLLIAVDDRILIDPLAAGP